MKRKSIKDYAIGENLTGYARIINKRNFGKISFWQARYNEENVQLILTKNETENYDQAKKIPIGNFIFLQGQKSISDSGEHSVQICGLAVVAHCAQKLPEKFHGLSQAHRYNRRVVDLICRSESFNLFKIISRALSEIRIFLYSMGYREFSTGILQEQFEGGASNSFVTTCNANGRTYHLSMTSELKLKRLLLAGFEKVFEITESFRNEGIDAIHAPEFSLLEAYSVGSTYYEIMDTVEQMVKKIVCENLKDGYCIYASNLGISTQVSFKQPFDRISFYDAFESLVGKKEDCIIEKLSEKFPSLFFADMARYTWIIKVIEKLLAPSIIKPTFLTDIPSGLSPFVKTNSSNPETDERAFFIAHNLVIADIYTDENDHKIIGTRLSAKDKEISREADKNFLDMLRYGLPQTAGVGMCLSKLFMLFLGTLPKNIKETILFPVI